MTAITYNAPKPKKPWSYWISQIIARVVFPPILIWDAMKYAMNYAFGTRICKLIVMSQDDSVIPKSAFVDTWVNNKLPNQIQRNLPNYGVQRVLVKTHDGALLDGAELKPKTPSSKHLIYFPGNAGCYESTLQGEALNDIRYLQCNTIVFNYRGVSQSQGYIRSTADIVNDGIAQVQRLLDDGVAPEKIYLKGMSLGAAVCTIVAAHFNDLGIQVNCFNRSSFSNITNVVVGQFRTLGQNGHTEIFIGKLIGWLIKPFLKFGLIICKCEMDAASAFLSLPPQNKEYMLVRSNRATRAAESPLDDVVIPHYASLHMGLKNERRTQKAFIDREIHKLRTFPSPSLAQVEIQKAISHLELARKEFKQRKMTTIDPNKNGHEVSLDEMSDNCYGHEGNIFFWSFFKRPKTLATASTKNIIESIKTSSSPPSPKGRIGRGGGGIIPV
jgi:pimeloyl-ACP methyl ester carboxylesterase